MITQSNTLFKKTSLIELNSAQTQNIDSGSSIPCGIAGGIIVQVLIGIFADDQCGNGEWG